jgi:hypothetical protein
MAPQNALIAPLCVPMAPIYVSIGAGSNSNVPEMQAIILFFN